MNKKILVTGGAGFIGSNFIIAAIESRGCAVLNLDLLTYAGHPESLRAVESSNRYFFQHGSIGDRRLVGRILREFDPDWLVNFAAESHVDRSILFPEAFVETNVLGTLRLLQEFSEWVSVLEPSQRAGRRFLHVSTDEVYGSLEADGEPFDELTRYSPNSPYAASKAGSDHLVRAFHQTYGLPAVITNCSNNYGPFQFPEKLIPLCILQAVRRRPIPLYGDGRQVRDWLYVEDHCEALFKVLSAGTNGETYNIGAGSEVCNADLVLALCDILDTEIPMNDGLSHRELIVHVADRPGHDRRYAVNSSKLRRELGWLPRHKLEVGLRRTVDWYLKNGDWLSHVTGSGFDDWVASNYGRR